jgi:carbon-monoxide dehydrogenase large subunit
VAHGIGNVLSEEMVYGDGGGLLSSSFLTYFLPRARDVPFIEIEHHACPSPFNPEGIKGAGEGGTIGALGTLAAAIEDALAPFGASIDRIPVHAEDIVRLCGRRESA